MLNMRPIHNAIAMLFLNFKDNDYTYQINGESAETNQFEEF